MAPSGEHSDSLIASADNRSNMLRMLPADVFFVILDVLQFPDVFSFSLTCKAIKSLPDLVKKKEEHREQLKKAKAATYVQNPIMIPPPPDISYTFKFDFCDPLATAPAELCDVCLYALPPSYFLELVVSGSFNIARNEKSICHDCAEFRRVLAGIARKDGEQRNAYIPWRPSRRIMVAGTDGFLWYRKRIG